MCIGSSHEEMTDLKTPQEENRERLQKVPTQGLLEGWRTQM